ncbi:hypothetical protein DFJ77DRAFT_139331 [Powellomyces hirtus]|nr:hypothetical protein DFJ77DRAFT_139331 [Powellomyces hirtus]
MIISSVQAEKPHDPPDGKAAPEANDSQLNMIEVLPFRSYEPRRVSKLGFKQFASSVEGGFQSISSSLSSFGSSLKGQMTRSDSYESQLPDILKSPQCPLASLSPDLLETPGREWESDLMVEDYILDVCDSQHIPYAEVRQLELAEEQDPFADAWEPRSHRSDSHENGSHGQVANVDQNEVNILQIPRSVTVPVKDMHRTSKASLLYHDSGRVPSPPQALVHQPRSWESDNTTSSEDPLISGNSREGRIKSTGLPDQDYFSFQPLPPGSLNALHCSGTRPIVISSSHKRIPISTWVFRSMRQPSKSRRKPRKVDGQENQFDHRDEEPTGLYRYPSTSTTCTKFTVASASSGSSAASLYLCHRCSLSGGGTTWSKKSASSKCGGHCKACGFPFPMSRSPPSRRSESSSASNQSEDSLSRFL